MNWEEIIAYYWRKVKKRLRWKLRIVLYVMIFYHAHADINDANQDYRSDGLDKPVIVKNGENGFISIKNFSGKFNWPLNNFRITSGFGWRQHPITLLPDFHKGIDLANKIGTKVHAAADGVVIYSGYHNSIIGWLVIISHGHGYKSYYGHLMKKGRVKNNIYVRQGQKIGFIGISGRTTGPHLHFAIYKNNKAINPLLMLHKF